MTQTTTTGASATAAAEQLRGSMRGSVLLPTELSYESAPRLWNGIVDRRPAVIARCETAEDVQAAVRAAREHDLPLSVRGGGHDWAGRAPREGGLTVDLSAMRGVIIGPDEGERALAGYGPNAPGCWP